MKNYIIQKTIMGRFKYYYRHEDYSWQGLTNNATKLDKESATHYFIKFLKNQTLNTDFELVIL